MKWKNASPLFWLLAIPAVCLLGSLHQQRHAPGGGMSASFADQNQTGATASPQQERQQNSVRQAVYECQFAEYSRAIPAADRAAVFFVSLTGGRQLRGSDPDASVIQALAHSAPRVKRGSCSISLRPADFTGDESDPQPTVRDRVSGAKGVQFSLSELRWISPFQVEVDGSYYQSNQYMGGSTFLVVRHGDSWQVEDEQGQWGSQQASGTESLLNALS